MKKKINLPLLAGILLGTLVMLDCIALVFLDANLWGQCCLQENRVEDRGRFTENRVDGFSLMAEKKTDGAGTMRKRAVRERPLAAETSHAR